MVLIECYEVIHTMNFLLNIFQQNILYIFLKQPTKQMSTNR